MRSPSISSLFYISIIIYIMAFQLPSFLSRFLRPFSISTSRSLQPDSLASMEFPQNTERAIFAGGCFWGLEQLFRRHWGNGKGLLDCRVGYTGGKTESPDYNEVCGGYSGHAESLLVAFDPSKVSYRQLLEFFFRIHDPTTLNRQGADTGSQYRSAIFTYGDEQMKIASQIKEKVGKEWYKGKPITTEVLAATKWYDAEDYHQLYLQVDEEEEKKKPDGKYHCPAHTVRPFPPLSD